MVRKKREKVIKIKIRPQTIEKRAKEFVETHGVSWRVADYALWLKEKDPLLSDKEAIVRAKKFWTKFEHFKKKREKGEI